MFRINMNARWIDYIIVFLMVVMSAGVSFLGATIFRFFLLIMAMGVLYFRTGKPGINKRFLFLFVYYLLWVTAIFWYFEINVLYSNQLFTYFSFFTLLLCAYYSVLAVNDFFRVYVKIIYYLCIVSFVFYPIQLLNLDILLKILRTFDPIYSIFRGGIVLRPSIVLFSYPADIGVTIRNSGFATEPGEFCVFLITALMMHITLNGFKIDRIIIVLFAATLTTLSTSGYIGLAILFVYYFINTLSSYTWLKNFRIGNFILMLIISILVGISVSVYAASVLYTIYVLFIYIKKEVRLPVFMGMLGIPVIIIIMSLDFVTEKVMAAIEKDSERYERAEQQRITPGRFGSMLLDMNDFLKNPIVGYGVPIQTRYINYGGIEQQRTNGLSDYLVRFGMFGFIIMIINLYLTFRLFRNNHNKGSILFFLLAFFIVTFSQVILATPFFLGLQYYHFDHDTVKQINST